MVKKKSRTHLTNDMKMKVAREYKKAPRNKKQEVMEKYGVSRSAICRWLADGILRQEKQSVKKQKRSPQDLLWDVVLDARASGKISTEDARRLLSIELEHD